MLASLADFCFFIFSIPIDVTTNDPSAFIVTSVGTGAVNPSYDLTFGVTLAPVVPVRLSVSTKSYPSSVIFCL